MTTIGVAANTPLPQSGEHEFESRIVDQEHLWTPLVKYKNCAELTRGLMNRLLNEGWEIERFEENSWKYDVYWVRDYPSIDQLEESSASKPE